MNFIRLTLYIILAVFLCGTFINHATTAQAAGKYEILPRDPKAEPVNNCKPPCGCGACKPIIEKNHKEIRAHMTDEFIKHRDWMIDEFFTKHVLPAMAMMTSQLSAVAIQQTQIVGTFFDAKHQLETQRLFQQLMAEAHKDYLPSEGLCEVGTLTRSLASSARRADLGHVVFANRTLQRQLRNKDTLSAGASNSDIDSRINSFLNNNCDGADNSNGLKDLCQSSITTSNNSSGGNNNNGSGNNNNNGVNNNGAGQNNNNNGTNNTSDEAGRLGFLARGTTPEGGDGKNLKIFNIIEYNNDIGFHNYEENHTDGHDNQHNHDNEDYNNSTGNYTAPKNGEYKFEGRVLTQDPEKAILAIQKNGLSIAEELNETPNTQSTVITITTNLLEGDVISLYTAEQLQIGSFSHRFKGEFIKGDDDDDDDDDGDDDDDDDDGENAKKKKNQDIDFARTVESKLTLDIDLTDASTETSPDETALFALTSNLFAHQLAPAIASGILATPDGMPREAAYRYLDLRSVTAKRSVAQNAFTAITSERLKGDKEVAPYLKKVVTELGVKEKDVEEILGKDPSYFAQMEVLTKDIYQNPVFYTELYDKPANVLRKGASIRAINLMQERDLYKSQLRSEAVLAIILETMLHDEHNRVNGELSDLSAGGEE